MQYLFITYRIFQSTICLLTPKTGNLWNFVSHSALRTLSLLVLLYTRLIKNYRSFCCCEDKIKLVDSLPILV